MNLKNKRVWDLNLKEIEYTYKNIHINNYIYAALKTFHESKIPYNKVLLIKKSKIPNIIQKYAEKIIELNPFLGNYDPTIIRTNYTYYVNNLFRNFEYINNKEIPDVLNFLASIAYIPIVAEKNDNFTIWIYKIIRDITPDIELFFNAVIDKKNINRFIEENKTNPILSNHFKKKCIKSSDPIEKTYVFLMFVKSIIVMTENNIDRKKIKNAWINLESLMYKYQIENNINSKKEKYKINNKKQLRYQNCIYLYGGDFFRRIKEYETAFEWYTKNILYDEIISKMSFFLTDMRICERLLCAYSISNSQNKNKIKNIILKCMHQIFNNIAFISNRNLNIIRTNHNNDLSQINIYTKDNLPVLYAGEPTRELFFLSLLYNKIINGIDYSEIDYNKFLKIK